MTLQGQQVHPPPSMDTERSGANSPSAFTKKKKKFGNMSLSKQARKRTIQESWEEKCFCYAQDDNVRWLLYSKVQKGIHKWNIRRNYHTVFCSKSAADAANLSFSHYGMCIAGCVVRRHREATLST